MTDPVRNPARQERRDPASDSAFNPKHSWAGEHGNNRADHHVSGPVGDIVCLVADTGEQLDDVLREVSSAPAPHPHLIDRVRTDDRLRQLLVGLEKVHNAIEATIGATMVAMCDEAASLDAAEFRATGLPARSHLEFVPDEISALIACTKMAASRRLGTAVQADRHPAVRSAWRAGQIDARKAAMLAEQLAPLEHHDAVRLAIPAVEHAATHTEPQTREWTRRRVIEINPDAAEQRRQAAQAERRVVITHGDDGMSELWARLPSVKARQVQQALTQGAHEVGADDIRTNDQRCADLLVDLILGEQQAPNVQLQVLVPAQTVLEGGEQPGWVPGVGPLTAPHLREVLAEAAKVHATTHTSPPIGVAAGDGTLVEGAPVASTQVNGVPVEGAPIDITQVDGDGIKRGYRPSAGLDREVRLRDITCRFPGCRRPALGKHTGTDLDHTIPWPQGATTATNLAVLCRRHHRLKHSTMWATTLDADGTMSWTTPTGRVIITHPWEHTTPVSDSHPAPDPRSSDPPPDAPSVDPPTDPHSSVQPGTDPPSVDDFHSPTDPDPPLRE